MPASSPGSRKIPSHFGHSSTTTSRLTLQKWRIITTESRGHLRRWFWSTFSDAFCGIRSGLFTNLVLDVAQSLLGGGPTGPAPQPAAYSSPREYRSEKRKDDGANVCTL